MTAERQTNRFLLLYALACAGGAVAYVPFLSILLPVKITTLAGQGSAASWLAYIAFAGAVAASLGNIGFGYVSDITGNRRGWTGLGLILSCAMLLAVSQAHSVMAVAVVVVAWQLCLNMMLAPLAAWAADCVPESQMGVLGGLMAFAPAIGALAGAFVTLTGLASADGRLVWVAAMVVACVLPLLVIAAPPPVQRGPMVSIRPDPVKKAPSMAPASGGVWGMWMARLIVQVAQVSLFSYLYFWLRSIDPAIGDAQTARTFGLIQLLSAPLALGVGRWADSRSRPLAPLVTCALMAALGLMAMALSKTMIMAIAAYGLFGFTTSVFLALHSAQTLRVLPSPARRGRDLGLFNLTNTLPSMIMPGLTLILLPHFGFSGLFWVLALLTLMAGLLMGWVRYRS